MNVGVVCEYNPLHLGHVRQFRKIRERFGEDCGIVCAMSGNFVQRGAPAIVDKSLRAQAAVLCGADLVVELPVTACVSSAEGFAAGAVEILSLLCDTLCFGTETGTKASLLTAAQGLLSPEFSPLLRQELEKGCSFPAARQAAMDALGLIEAPMHQPNDILAVEYCKAILAQGADLDIYPIYRPGSYHALEADRENPSATAVRAAMLSGGPWQDFVPPQARECLAAGALHSLSAGERAILARLRSMTDADFASLPYGSEGLWRKLMHASRQEASLEEIFTTVKSKRYTRTRLQRMVMCALLGITETLLTAPVPYSRVLAFNDRGRQILSAAKKTGRFRNAGEAIDHPNWALETRAGDLYGLFCTGLPEAPGCEAKRRIVYLP